MKEKEEEMFLKSKIIKTIEDQNKLLAFFTEKKVVGAEILYRASENEFLVSKWHEKCDHIPHTLTIIETEFGKVIGGYTSFSWYKDTTNHYVSSRKNSNDHFIFSLTNNDKFIITQNEANCIQIPTAVVTVQCLVVGVICTFLTKQIKIVILEVISAIHIQTPTTSKVTVILT